MDIERNIPFAQKKEHGSLTMDMKLQYFAHVHEGLFTKILHCLRDSVFL